MNDQRAIVKNAQRSSETDLLNTITSWNALWGVITLSIIAGFFAGLATKQRPESERLSLPKPNATGADREASARLLDFRAARLARLSARGTSTRNDG